MKSTLLATSALFTALVAAPALAQHQDHTGHAEPATQDHSQHQAEEAHQGHAQPETDHSGHAMAEADHGRHAMTGALGNYPMSRDAAATAWQPDASVHPGVHVQSGDWSLMGHALLNGVYDWQEGPRGGDKAFVAGMVMGMATRRFESGGTLQFRAMLSPDPLMGKSGYPLHLASGETADGVNPLIDRQHPHDLFMELSASYSQQISDKTSLFVYGGLPGAPAFGPPAFMHRMSAMDSPEAPISHHWLDSTHITFGVLTAGLVHDGFKLEASRFNGREPDQNRYDIETGPLDSTAVRLAWNPSAQWSLQASWADLKSPEQLEPDEDQKRWSASAAYTRPMGDNGWWATTLAWGRKIVDHHDYDAWVLESAYNRDNWTVFGRGEMTENNELVPGAGHHGATYDVGKISLGAIRDFDVAKQVKVGVGALYAFNFVPGPLEALYAGDPKGAMAFVRLKIG